MIGFGWAGWADMYSGRTADNIAIEIQRRFDFISNNPKMFTVNLSQKQATVTERSLFDAKMV